VVTTNRLIDPVIVGNINYKEAASDTDSRNLISEISNKANLNAPNFSTSLQLNSTNVLLQPGDFNGSLQAYIELKAPEQTPPDLSGLVSKPGDYNGDLESYIQLKAPEPDLSGYSLTTEIDDELLLKADKSSLAEFKSTTDVAFENLQNLSEQNLTSVTVRRKAESHNPYFVIDSISGAGSQDWLSLESIVNTLALKNSTFILDDIAGPEERITFSDIVTAHAPPPANLTAYADRDEVSETINSELGNYTNTVDLDAQLEGYVINDELGNYTTTAAINSQLEGYLTSGELESYTPDLSTVIEKPGDYEDNDLATYIQSKAPSGYKVVGERITLKSTFDPDQDNEDISHEREYDETTHSIPDGTYTAKQLLEILKDVVTEFMRYVFIMHGVGIVQDETIINLNRFNSWNITDKNDDISFEIDINWSNSIIENFDLPFAFLSATSSISGGNKRISFDYDLSEIFYSNLEDRIAQEIMTIAPNDMTPVETLQTQYDGLSIDLQIVQIARYEIEDDVEEVKNEFEVVKTGFNELASGGNYIENKKFDIEGQYYQEQEEGGVQTGPGNGASDYTTDYKRLYFDGTYTATEIIKKLGEDTTKSMRDLFYKEGLTIINEITDLNLERFYINFLVPNIKDIGFVFWTDMCPIITNIFNFERMFQTTTTNEGDNLRVKLYINLLANKYPKIDDRISRIIIGLENRVISLEGGYGGGTRPPIEEEEQEPIKELTTTYQNTVWQDVEVSGGHSYKITLYGQAGDWGSPDDSRNPDCQPPGMGAVLTCIIKLPSNAQKLRIHTSLGVTNKGNFGGMGGSCTQIIIIYSDGSEAKCVAIAGGGGGGGHGYSAAHGGNAGGFTGVSPNNELAGGGGGWNYNGIGDSPGPSATRVLGEDGALYGNGGTGNEGYGIHAGGGGASSFMGRYLNSEGVWVAHKNNTTITNGLKDGINHVTYYNVSRFEANDQFINDGYAIIESGQAIEDQT